MAEPMLVDDDDVMVVEDLQSKEPVVIDDDDDETPITTEKRTPTKVMDSDSEKLFINNLENNRLMDKIVTRCLTMENATGMSRVVKRTLLPRYREASNRFKESVEFRTMLKRTYKLLMKDPEYKFLHLQRLCEELKSGGLRRNVPFVTLANKVKKNLSQSDYPELTSSSKKMDHNIENNEKTVPIPEVNRRNYATRKTYRGAGKNKDAKRKKVTTTRDQTGPCADVTHTDKTDIIELDDSETESANDDHAKNDSVQNDIIIIDETDQRKDNLITLLPIPLEVPTESNKNLQVVLGDSNKENKVKHSNNENKMIQKTLEENSYKNNIITQSTLETDSAKQNTVIQGTFPIDYNYSNKFVQPTLTNVYDEDGKFIGVEIETDSHRQNKATLEALRKYANQQNTMTLTILQKDASKYNEGLRVTKEENNKNGVASDTGMDYDLMIPKNHLQVLPKEPVTVLPIESVKIIPKTPINVTPKPNVSAVPSFYSKDEEIASLERRIADYKKRIDELEEAEVTTESYQGSPYYLCSRYKEEVIECYKMICKLKGNNPEIVKRREIRLKVTENHPPGPAKILEDLLNRSINSTGSIAFPDFSDVYKCVLEADLADDLHLDKHEIMQEAVALFRQCGQALRKQRQKREYKDLLSLIRNKEETDDPAEKDPLLLAKLEENKRIAREKEEEILDRFVALEQTAGAQHTQVDFDSNDDSSDAELESEQNITTSGESSRNDLNFVYQVPNNLNLPCPVMSNCSNAGLSSNTNNVILNNVVVTPTPTVVAPGTINPMLMTYFIAAPTAPQNFINNVIIVTNDNQSSIRERLTLNNNVVNNNSEVIPPIAAHTAQQNFVKDMIIVTNDNQSSMRERLTVNNNVVYNNSEVIPPITAHTAQQNFVKDMIIVTNENQPSTRERLTVNHDGNNNSEAVPTISGSLIPEVTQESPTFTKSLTPEITHELPTITGSLTPEITYESEETDTSDNEEKVNIETELTITETTVGIKTETSEECDVPSLSNNIGDTDLTANNQSCNINDVQNTVSSLLDGMEQNSDSTSINTEGVLVKTENHVKSEPLDIQNMLDELGDDFVCQVFDVEDPFLVIEISSDESSDEEEL